MIHFIVYAFAAIGAIVVAFGLYVLQWHSRQRIRLWRFRNNVKVGDKCIARNDLTGMHMTAEVVRVDGDMIYLRALEHGEQSVRFHIDRAYIYPLH